VLLTQRSLSFHIRRVREYHVYIMASRSGVLYIGVTNDLTRRVSEHQRKAVPGFTARYRVSRLVHFESFDQVRDAIAREKQLKGWRREKKIALIEKANSAWRDLSEGWFDSRDPSTSSG
jgi:putative endonuclease